MMPSQRPRLPRLRTDLEGLPLYKAGQRPTQGGPTYSLASNESPFPPSEAVLDAIAQAARAVHRYPDPSSGALTAALAEQLQVSGDRLALGTGSVALCQQIVTVAAGPGDEVVFAWRSFEAYPIVTGVAGARAVTVPLTLDGRHDLAAMAAAVSDRTRVVFLCTPNNPTGPALSAAAVAEFLDTVAEDLLVVLDEAYFEYVTDPDAVDGIAVVRARPNVVALRTLSKAYGLAGLRVGYAVGHPDLIARIRSVGVPFGVSRIAEAAGLAVLAEPQEIGRRAAEVVAQRSRVVAALTADGWELPQAQGNFVWLPMGGQAERFAAHCGDYGLTVRAFPGDGVLVTVAEPAANDQFLAAARAWQAGRG
jgi:histidinol-phosphate aminotransferase